MLIPIRPQPYAPVTELHLGRHLLQTDLLSSSCKRFGSRAVLIADRALKELYAEPLAQKLKADLLCLEGGELAKTADTKEQIEEFLFERRCGRDTVLLALGGGSLTDVAGFAASTYLRGIPLILIPTTLLAMVDASIGGKTAINTRFGKNQLGTIYHPKLIVSDLETLQSLPEKEWLNGRVEILKMGLIAKPELLQNLSFEEIVAGAIQGKIDVIEQDPQETGPRRMLNFGHTIGHAIEASAPIAHGAAVAIGCAVESYLSVQLGHLSKPEFEKIKSLLPFERLPAAYNRRLFLERLKYDKKNANQDVRCVLLDQIGRASPCEGSYCRAIPEEKLLDAIHWMEKTHG